MLGAIVGELKLNGVPPLLSLCKGWEVCSGELKGLEAVAVAVLPNGCVGAETPNVKGEDPRASPVGSVEVVPKANGAGLEVVVVLVWFTLLPNANGFKGAVVPALEAPEI